MKNRYREQIGGDQKAQTSKYKISHVNGMYSMVTMDTSCCC